MFFLCSSDFHFLPKCFLQNQHVAAKFHLFVFYLFIFFLSLLLSLCFPVVCMLFIFCLSDLFWIFSCLFGLYIYIMFWSFFVFIVFLDFFGVLWGIRVHNACVHSSFRDDEIYHPLFLHEDRMGYHVVVHSCNSATSITNFMRYTRPGKD